MRQFLIGLLLTCSTAASAQQAPKPINVKKEFAFAAKQYDLMLQAHPDLKKIPHSSNADGTLRDKPPTWWCSGFFGGSLWYIFEQTKSTRWKVAADRWTMAMAGQKTNNSNHDLGFMLYCPFGNGYRLTQNPTYKEVLLGGADALATRYYPDYGLIKSWDEHKGYDFPVIIDNMMNLELLFWAAKESGNKRLYDLSVSHADSTIKHHFRADYSTYHVVAYGKGGKVLKQKTHQGYSDESAWARGQAWALYGYTLMYRETQDPKYLAQARGIADFYLNHPNLPADKIPYWDFNAPSIPNEERDASAGAVVASGLLELCTYGGPDSQKYYRSAVQMLNSLSSPAYKAKLGTNNNFLLKHSVGAKPLGIEIDVPLVYADYYYLEALLRYDKLHKQPAYKL